MGILSLLCLVPMASGGLFITWFNCTSFCKVIVQYTECSYWPESPLISTLNSARQGTNECSPGSPNLPIKLYFTSGLPGFSSLALPSLLGARWKHCSYGNCLRPSPQLSFCVCSLITMGIIPPSIYFVKHSLPMYLLRQSLKLTRVGIRLKFYWLIRFFKSFIYCGWLASLSQ